MAHKKVDKILQEALPNDPEIRAEYKRLLDLYKKAPENKLNLAKKLIARAAFMGVTLDRLEKEIIQNGWEEEYQNGKNQSGKKQSASAALHVSMTKSYGTVIKQLNELLPATNAGGDLFETF